MKFGWEGYGLYWAIVEKLRESSDYTSVCDYNVIAYDLRSDAAKIKSIVNDFGLFAFTENGKRFYSESLKHRMTLKDEKSDKAKKAAESRWKKKAGNADAMQTHSERNADAMQVKKSKVNDIAVNSISEPPVKPPNTFGYVPDHESLKAELKKPSSWKDMFGKQAGVSNPDDRDEWIDEFIEHAIASGKGESILKVSDAQSWITNWVRKRTQAGETPKSRNRKVSSSDHLAAVAGIPLN